MLSFKDLSDYYDMSEEETAILLFCLKKFAEKNNPQTTAQTDAAAHQSRRATSTTSTAPIRH